MKLTNKQIRQLIREELQSVLESQDEVGLPHKYSNKALVQHTMDVIARMTEKYGREEPPYASEDYVFISKLIRILSNAIQKAVKHDEGTDELIVKGGKIVKNPNYKPATTPEQTAFMRDEQGELKAARYALATVIGMEYRYSNADRSAISDKMRELSKSGTLEPGMQPSDVPELRAQMPEYQPGGRFYDPDDIIHKR